MRRLLGVAALLVLALGASCVAPGGPGELGVENGYRYDDAIAVTVEDGLNESEREALLGRTMARVEVIRELEFLETTDVTVISRSEYRNRTGSPPDTANLSEKQLWNEQVWEALHVIGENETYPGARASNRGSSVVGYYSSSKSEIVLVSDSPTPQVTRGTLVHELVHALQDQHLHLGASRQLQDEQLAVRGVIEGDANYVEALYENRCGASWVCVETPRATGQRSDSFNQGLFLVSYLPYAEGPQFVEALRDRGDWAAVDDSYETLPESTEQVIHPERYPDDEPATVTVPDRSDGEWERFDDLDRPVHDTVGEGSIYAMFVTNGVIDRSGAAQYNYEHPISTGWAGDRLVPYRNGSGGYGYVWRLSWETPEEAREFADGYRELLDGYDAERLDGGRYVIGDGAFADAFRLSRDGRTVTVVNAPIVEGLDDVHAPA
ncbi:Hvo_1808 family surface protein [Halapricum hydrolyticum]|uniref:Hvo_1808 family surface protein n=1 Tax=Halapricum hydrolyticum TaxID=2979991 RepID=A0AAE3IAA7_9EURY|nr:Hvo_1808 family surface protein [Halapricum hydrolyticum]MCU4717670.1 Hvo_1808 family surface protein [Halapricum hydrolyticum]MCU4726801.1 Hvo_1808 family surface protein [Halapricum hydrolyticum]